MTESLRDKIERLGRIKEGIQVLRIGIEEKASKKEELAKLYDEKKLAVEYVSVLYTPIRSAEKELKNEINGLDKEIETDAIYFRRELSGLTLEISETKGRMAKSYAKYGKLMKEKEMYERSALKYRSEKMIEEIKKEADNTYGFKVAKFRSSVAPLEDAVRAIEQQKEKLLMKIKMVMDVKHLIGTS